MSALAARLKYARNRLALTLAQVKVSTNIAESSLSDFENGNREPKLSQLQSLAEVYQRSIEFFLSKEDIPAELVLWRERPSKKAEDIEAIFLKYCTQYRNLEIWNKAVLNSSLPLANGDSDDYSYGDADELAKVVRDSLALGDRPGIALLRVLEEKCGVKIIHENFEPTGTAASTKSPDIGLAILLNASNKRWRRNFDLAHELFHLLTWDLFEKPTDGSITQASDKEEKFANAFASSLLLPAEAINVALKHYRRTAAVPIEVFFDIARQFDVSVEAVIWRWHTLGPWRSRKEEKTRNLIEKAEKLNRLLEKREDTKPSKWPDRYNALAVNALRTGRISIGRYAEYMEISRREAMKEHSELEAHVGEETPVVAV